MDKEIEAREMFIQSTVKIYVDLLDELRAEIAKVEGLSQEQWDDIGMTIITTMERVLVKPMERINAREEINERLKMVYGMRMVEEDMRN